MSKALRNVNNLCFRVGTLQENRNDPENSYMSLLRRALNLLKDQGFAGLGWGLAGNAGTNSSTSFIGTTDAQDFVVKTNNAEAVRVKQNKDIVVNGIILGRGNSSDISNTIFGNGSGSNLIGVNNVFFGYLTGSNATNSSNNTILGYSSGSAIIAGSNNNVYIGSGSGGNGSGSGCTYIGVAAGGSIVGDFNTCIGLSAGSTILGGSPCTSATSSILIGRQSSPLGNAQTNQIIIGDGTIGLGSNTTTIGNSFTLQTNLFGNLTLGTTTNITSALLNLTSTTKALLLPRMTKAQRDAISSPLAGYMVYQTDNTPGLRTYNGTNWMRYTETAD